MSGSRRRGAVEPSARRRDEIERIKQKLRNGVELQQAERDTLLRALEPEQEAAPSGLSQLHELHHWIAAHYRWLRENGERSAAKRVGKMWGVSPAMVRHCAGEHSTVELDAYLLEAKAEPPEAVQMQFEWAAWKFRELKKVKHSDR